MTKMAFNVPLGDGNRIGMARGVALNAGVSTCTLMHVNEGD